MTHDVLSRFRSGLAKGEFTLTQIAEVSGIPLTTLSDMKDEGWQTKALTRLAELDCALKALRKPAGAGKRRRSGEAVSA